MEARNTERFTFSIRTLLVITAFVAVHVGIPVLGRALLATIVAALVLNLISIYPLAALSAIWQLIRGGDLRDYRNAQKWVGRLCIIILFGVYLTVAIYGLVAAS